MGLPMDYNQNTRLGKTIMSLTITTFSKFIISSVLIINVLAWLIAEVSFGLYTPGLEESFNVFCLYAYAYSSAIAASISFALIVAALTDMIEIK